MTEYLWYLARGSGLVSLVLLTGVVVLGIVQRSGRPLPGLPRFAVGAVHRNVSLLAVVFLATHVLTLLADPYAQLKLINIVVPFMAGYQPFWSGLGTLGLDLIAALVVTGLLRRRLGHRAFRLIHWLAYLCWPVALGHAVGTGTDSSQLWLTGTTIACAAAVVVAILWRLGTTFTETAAVRLEAPRVVAPPSVAARRYR